MNSTWRTFWFGGSFGAGLTGVALVLGYMIVTAPPVATANDVAGQMGVSIVWDSSGCSQPSTACFSRFTPDVIYVDQSVAGTWYERDVILHELGHVLQYRFGLPLDECHADQIARDLGATWTGYDCD